MDLFMKDLLSIYYASDTLLGTQVHEWSSQGGRCSRRFLPVGRDGDDDEQDEWVTAYAGKR